MKTFLNNYWSWIIAGILYSLLISCDIQKEAAKTKSETEFKENIETQTFRKGDTVRYEIPKINFIDTTIYRTNRQGTTLKTVYNTEGNIASIDCFASAISEFRKENREFQQLLKDKESNKKEEFDSSFIFYIMSAVALIVVFALFLMFLYVKKNTSLVTQFLNK